MKNSAKLAITPLVIALSLTMGACGSNQEDVIAPQKETHAPEQSGALTEEKNNPEQSNTPGAAKTPEEAPSHIDAIARGEKPAETKRGTSHIDAIARGDFSKNNTPGQTRMTPSDSVMVELSKEAAEAAYQSAKAKLDEEVSKLKKVQAEWEEMRKSAPTPEYRAEVNERARKATDAYNVAASAYNAAKHQYEDAQNKLNENQKAISDLQQKKEVLTRAINDSENLPRQIETTKAQLAAVEQELDSVPAFDWKSLTHDEYLRVTEVILADMLNHYRENAGMTRLAYSPSLSDESRAWSDHILKDPGDPERGIKSTTYEHSDLSGNQSRFGEANDSGASAENIQMRSHWPENPNYTERGKNPEELAADLFDAWKQSAGHNDNYLNPTIVAQSIGISETKVGNAVIQSATWRGYSEEYLKADSPFDWGPKGDGKTEIHTDKGVMTITPVKDAVIPDNVNKALEGVVNVDEIVKSDVPATSYSKELDHTANGRPRVSQVEEADVPVKQLIPTTDTTELENRKAELTNQLATQEEAAAKVETLPEQLEQTVTELDTRQENNPTLTENAQTAQEKRDEAKEKLDSATVAKDSAQKDADTVNAQVKAIQDKEKQVADQQSAVEKAESLVK